MTGRARIFSNITSRTRQQGASQPAPAQLLYILAMRLKRHVPLLESTLQKNVAIRTRPSPQWLRACTHALRLGPYSHHRYSSTTSTDGPERVAVLGGGISGLSSAYYINKEFPNAKITIFEKQDKLGGWISSRRVDVPGGNILFEQGPRTLRNAVVTASLIQDLDLIDDVIYTKKSDPGAKNRFIYYPDRLNRLPAEPPGILNLYQLWSSGMLNGAFGILKEPMVAKRSSDSTLR